jgi:hypothetical protein
MNHNHCNCNQSCNINNIPWRCHRNFVALSKNLTRPTINLLIARVSMSASSIPPRFLSLTWNCVKTTNRSEKCFRDNFHALRQNHAHKSVIIIDSHFKVCLRARAALMPDDNSFYIHEWLIEFERCDSHLIIALPGLVNRKLFAPCKRDFREHIVEVCLKLSASWFARDPVNQLSI